MSLVAEVLARKRKLERILQDKINADSKAQKAEQRNLGEPRAGHQLVVLSMRREVLPRLEADQRSIVQELLEARAAIDETLKGFTGH